jgi:ABC-type nitrate/sulfonate/bicarbonate transport system permease component
MTSPMLIALVIVAQAPTKITVLDNTFHPAPGATVNAVDSSGLVTSATTDSSGVASLRRSILAVLAAVAAGGGAAAILARRLVATHKAKVRREVAASLPESLEIQYGSLFWCLRTPSCSSMEKERRRPAHAASFFHLA